MSLQQLDAPPPDDGMTIEGAVADNGPVPIEALPVSKLPERKQFGVLSQQLRADIDHSADWRKDANYWFGFRAGDQWTDEDRALLEGQDRPVIVFNRILTILKAVAGLEINGRHEIDFIPRGTEDTKPNEVLTAASRWMADSCDGEDEESQAFDQCSTTGMGWCENRMSYLDDPAGLYIEEMVDCREMYWDKAAKKKNLADARRLSRVRKMAFGDALAMFPGRTFEELNAVWADDGAYNGSVKSIEEKRKRDSYTNASDMVYDLGCEVTIVHMQWWELETYWLVADTATNQKTEMSEAQYRQLDTRMKTLYAKLGVEAPPIHAAKLQRRVYKHAFLGGADTMLKPAGPAPISGQFSWKCITGEYDGVKRTWFGLVKILRDPQMWANKWLSQILHILNSTAKGGILAETSAFDDQREAEDSYAMPESITWLADGALSGDNPKIMEKPGKGMVDGYLGLLTFAISAFKDVSGINLELLGQQDQNQPGILEAMRKQAGMTVLATLFDSLRRFRKQTGRARLFFIQNFLSDGRLIRVAGPDSVNAVRLAKDKTVGEYDVAVDDAPTSPNQKEANWQIIQPLIVVFKDQLMANPKVFAMLLEYSPLPARIVDAIKQFIDQQANDPKAQQRQEEDRQLAIGLQTSEISKNQSVAELNNKKAGATEATAMYDIAMAKNLLMKNDQDGLKAHLDMMEAGARAKEVDANTLKTHADVANTMAKTERERVGTHLDVADAHMRKRQQDHEAGAGMISGLIDHLTAHTNAVKGAASARKDHAIAHREERTPIVAKPAA